jgi:signal transduction histidine kinase
MRLGDTTAETLAELRESCQALQVLSEVSRALAAATLDLPAIATALSQQVAAGLGDSCTVRLVGDQGAPLFAEAPAQAPGPCPPAGTLTVPLVVDGQPVGTLQVDRWARSYSLAERKLLQEIADRASLAVAAARQHAALEAERQRLEAALQQMRSARNEQVVDITAQKEAAREREKLIEELSRTVHFSEMFVGILGHDLRNPLSAITTAASVLLRRADNERNGRRAARILNSANRMGRMIDQILDFTRIRLGQGLPLACKPTDLAELCRLVIDEFEGETLPEVQVETVGEALGIWDPDRLSQLISNLLGNAIEHGDRAQPVGIRVDASDSRVVVLEVRNSGAVAPEVVPLIFEPFRAAEDRKHARSSGLGLGLFITEQIAMAHGGRIDLKSSPDEGTRFVVRLPRNLDESAPI